MIYKGTTKIKDIKLGNTQIKKVYKGTELVWQKGIPAYAHWPLTTTTQYSDLYNKVPLTPIHPLVFLTFSGKDCGDFRGSRRVSFGKESLPRNIDKFTVLCFVNCAYSTGTSNCIRHEDFFAMGKGWNGNNYSGWFRVNKTWRSMQTNITPSWGNWQMIAMTFDGNKGRFYVNAIMQAEVDMPGVIGQVTTDTHGAYGLGGENTTNLISANFTGYMHNGMMFTECLNQSQLQDIYNQYI